MRWGEHGDGLVVVVWSSSEVATMATTDTTTDDYTNDKPPPLRTTGDQGRPKRAQPTQGSPRVRAGPG